MPYLNALKAHVATSTETMLPSLESLPQIEFQSYTEVAEGKSTLLEVHVSSSGSESYQWSKDGQQGGGSARVAKVLAFASFGLQILESDMCSLHELLCILLIMSCNVLLVCHELC